MRVLYSIFVALLVLLFFTRCDQLRVFGRDGGSGGVSSGGRGGDNYGTDDEYGDNNGGGGGYTDYSGGGYDDDDLYCPAGDGNCEEDELFDRDYDDLEDEYDGAGGRVDFTSSNTIQEYRLGRRANHPIENGRVYVDMNREGNHRYYSGQIEVAFKMRHQGVNKVYSQQFHSGWGDDNRYNVWARFGGRLGFHAFFSDSYKGVILVIDQITNVTSERTEQDKINLKNQLGSGSIWFKSFRSHHPGNHNDCYKGGTHIGMGAPGSPPAPNKRCWFINVGPWNCQAWEAGDSVRTFMALEPDRNSCYKKLGDFKNLNISKAFDTDDGDVYIAVP